MNRWKATGNRSPTNYLQPNAISQRDNTRRWWNADTRFWNGVLAGELQAFTSGCSHPPADLLLAKSDSSTTGADAPALPVLQLVTHACTPPPRSAPGQAPQGLPSELRYVLLRSTSPSTRGNPVPRPPRENLSFSNSEEELVNKEERGSVSENIFSRGSGGAECICWLTAGTGREGKAAGISVREETRSWAMLWAVQEKLSSPTAAHCLSGIRHPLLPQHPTLLSLLAKMHVKHDEPATLKRS